MLAWRERVGGSILVRVERNEPLVLRALLQEKDSDRGLLIVLSINAGEPPSIANIKFQPATLPPDLAIPRLTQTEALVALAARADQLARDDRFVGALRVARQGEVLLQKAWGDARREPKVPATLETQFRLGSMNKIFTAVATLQLVEAGKPSPDVLGRHLSEYPNKDAASKVTVHHLLNHTGGTGDIFGPEFVANRGALKEHGDYLRVFGCRGLDHPPGSEYHYSNYGYVLLGALIEGEGSLRNDRKFKRPIFDAGWVECGGWPGWALGLGISASGSRRRRAAMGASRGLCSDAR